MLYFILILTCVSICGSKGLFLYINGCHYSRDGNRWLKTPCIKFLQPIRFGFPQKSLYLMESCTQVSGKSSSTYKQLAPFHLPLKIWSTHPWRDSQHGNICATANNGLYSGQTLCTSQPGEPLWPWWIHMPPSLWKSSPVCFAWAGVLSTAPNSESKSKPAASSSWMGWKQVLFQSLCWKLCSLGVLVIVVPQSLG